MDQVTIIEQRDVREQFIDQVGVLHKVKVLTMLPDNLHVTTDMLANYYEVSEEVIRQTVVRNGDELSEDGVMTLYGEQLSDMKSRCQISSRAKAMTFFPRRAILRIGMLLRDSEVARRVRDYLLNTEEIATPEHRHAAFEHRLPQTYLDALKELVRAEEERVRLVELNGELQPKAEMFDVFLSAENTQTISDVARTLGVGPRKLHDFLREQGVIFKSNDDYVPYAKYKPYGYFQVVQKPVGYGESTINRKQTRVTPKGVEFIAQLLKNPKPVAVRQATAPVLRLNVRSS